MFMADSDLQFISEFLVSLQYLNLRGCISLTDVGIASLLLKCPKLHSVLVCDTSFGINSVLALCSSPSDYVAGQHIENIKISIWIPWHLIFRHFIWVAASVSVISPLCRLPFEVYICCYMNYYFVTIYQLNTFNWSLHSLVIAPVFK